MFELNSGNCKEVLREYDENTFHSVVTDPPYELGFMGKKWDDSGIAFDIEMWEEVLRVLRPGGHLLAFSGTRTHHRMMVAIEDAGFEIRNCLMWVFCTGFPKSYSIDKDIDKELGFEDEREVVGEKEWTVGGGNSLNLREGDAEKKIQTVTEPASEEAKKWEGWATSLKPAYEPITLARKPLSEDNVARNVLRHGTGVINIDGCRIPTNDDTERTVGNRERDTYSESGGMFKKGGGERKTGGHPGGRWPANLILDDRASVEIDEQSGDTSSTRIGNPNNPKRGGNSEPVWGMSDGSETYDYRDEGGASRLFYCPKAHKSERDLGCEDGENDHPTVKPVELMSYLVRLVTPENGKVLDPFVGSGSTGIASILEQKNFVGIDLDSENVELASKRINYTRENYQRVYDFFFDDPSNEITKKDKSTIDHDFWD